MPSEGTRRAGTYGTILGAVMIVVGAILTATVAGAPAGGALIAAGTVVMTASSIAVAMNAPEPRTPERHRGKAFGFDQWRNPVGDDEVIPVVYGRTKMAPVFTQAYLTPVDKRGRSLHGDGAITSKNQALSLMCVCSEGPLPKDWLEQVEINDQALWESVVNEIGFVSDGLTKKYQLSRSGIIRDSLILYVDGVQKTDLGGVVSDIISIGYSGPTGTSIDKIKNHTHNAGEGVIVDMDSIRVYFNSAKNEVDASIYPYTIVAHTKRKFTIKFEKIPAKTYVAVGYDYSYDDDSIAITQDTDFNTWVRFATAPTQGTMIRYDADLTNYPTITIESRRGEVNQPPIEGANEVRSTESLNGELTEGEAISYTTERPVDDVSITIAALTGMIRYHIGKDSGKTGAIQAQVSIAYKKTSDTPWILLPDPNGAVNWILKGESEVTKRWDISIKQSLKLLAEAGRISEDVLEDFDRDQYDVRVVRVDAVKEGTSDQNRNRIWWSHVTEIQEEKLSYPGVAYFVLHGVGSAKLQGGVPRIAAVIKGREVKNLDTGVVEWSQNPAYCIADMLMNTRFGGSIPEADLIAQDWIDWADWCDESVTLDDKTTETRCFLGVVLDYARPPLAWANDLAFTAWGSIVLKGSKWSVVIDKARAVDKWYYYEGATSNTELSSLQTGLESRVKSPTEIEVQYIDVDEGYDRQTVLIPPATRSGDRQKKVISVNGCTRRTQAIRLGEHVLRSTQLQKQVLEFFALPDGCLSEAGDVIAVKSDIGGWASTGKKWRVLRVGFDSQLRVRLLCREYSDQLYATESTAARASRTNTHVNRAAKYGFNDPDKDGKDVVGVGSGAGASGPRPRLLLNQKGQPKYP
jgi:hypothetical protein